MQKYILLDRYSPDTVLSNGHFQTYFCVYTANAYLKEYKQPLCF